LKQEIEEKSAINKAKRRKWRQDWFVQGWFRELRPIEHLKIDKNDEASLYFY